VSGKITELSIKDVWQKLFESQPEQVIFKLAGNKEARLFNYNVSAFYKRVARIAAVFERVLNIKPGTKLLLSVDDNNDFALILHGALLAGLVVVPTEADLSLDNFKVILKNLQPEAVVFPAAATAKAAGLVSSAPFVHHWIAPGRNDPSSAGATIGGGIQRLDSLLLSVSAEEYVGSDLASGGINYNQIFIPTSLLLNSVGQVAKLIDPICGVGNFWNNFEIHTLPGLTHSLILPLFISAPALVRRYEGVDSFWQQMLADDIQTAFISFSDLQEIMRKGKSRTWRKSDNFQIIVSDEVRLDGDMIDSFTKKFHVDVGVAFYLKSSSTYLSIRNPVDRDIVYTTDESGVLIPSYGQAVSTLQVEFEPLAGQYITGKEQLEWGKVKYFFGEDLLDTGIRGALKTSTDPFGASLLELFVGGYRREILVKEGRVINLASVLNCLRQLQGVTAARVVMINDNSDYGLYVAPHRLADINKYDVDIYLAENLKAEELPQKILIASKGEDITLLSLEQLEERMLRGK
jgi:hypothetical protein